jgi:hypothetical protein
VELKKRVKKLESEKSKVAKVELENTELKGRMWKLEDALLDLKKTVEQLAD